jgi:hypothetical protein
MELFVLLEFFFRLLLTGIEVVIYFGNRKREKALIESLQRSDQCLIPKDSAKET